jgi:vacuolar-type H+-ATPase subunit I/STV1
MSTEMNKWMKSRDKHKAEVQKYRDMARDAMKEKKNAQSDRVEYWAELHDKYKAEADKHATEARRALNEYKKAVKQEEARKAEKLAEKKREQQLRDYRKRMKQVGSKEWGRQWDVKKEAIKVAERQKKEEEKNQAKWQSDENEREAKAKELEAWKETNPFKEAICPYCQKKGYITTFSQREKKGFSTGKATFGVLTAGVSLLATGLAKKGYVTTRYCRYCNMSIG